MDSNSNYSEMIDREIVHRAQSDDEAASEYLISKYQYLVRTKVQSYFLIGSEEEDLLQVGEIGLWQAIVDFRPDQPISFQAFAKICIQRHIITAIKIAARRN
jgi:RNA polymerase sporulation-specific sigma factor